MFEAFNGWVVHLDEYFPKTAATLTFTKPRIFQYVKIVSYLKFVFCLEASLVRNNADRVTGVKCRATNVDKKRVNTFTLLAEGGGGVFNQVYHIYQSKQIYQIFKSLSLATLPSPEITPARHHCLKWKNLNLL